MDTAVIHDAPLFAEKYICPLFAHVRIVKVAELTVISVNSPCVILPVSTLKTDATLNITFQLRPIFLD